MAKPGIRIGTPLTRTVTRPYARFSEDAYVPDWDRIPGMSQHAMRVTLKSPPSFSDDEDHPPAKSNHPKF